MLSPSSVRLHSEAMTYTGIDKCDHCGQPLEQGQWLVGLCALCEQDKNQRRQDQGDLPFSGRAIRPWETLKPRRGL